MSQMKEAQERLKNYDRLNKEAASDEVQQNDLTRVEHCIRKWHWNLSQPTTEGWALGVDSCALCVEYFNQGCNGCPLDKIGENCCHDGSAYQLAAEIGEGKEMIDALYRAREYVLSQK